jgi:hypothetical protein
VRSSYPHLICPADLKRRASVWFHSIRLRKRLKRTDGPRSKAAVVSPWRWRKSGAPAWRTFRRRTTTTRH